MEGGSEGEKEKKPMEGEHKTKRKMKSASQLEVLEKTYAVEAYPSEALRAELSVKLGLSDRQLQMWFCHRRLKDRKTVPATNKPQNDSLPEGVALEPVGEGVEQVVMADVRNDCGLTSGMRQFGHLDPQRILPRSGILAFPRMGAGLPAMESSSYYEPHQTQTIEGQRAIAFVERQLGEPVREDGPILGMEFDSLPPGAFGAPIGTVRMGQHGHSGRPFEAKIYEQMDKGVSRTLHEYQFIPEKPTVTNEANERLTSSIHYSSLDGIPRSRTLLSSGRPFLNGNESEPCGCGVQGQIPGLNIFTRQGRQSHLLSPASGVNDGVPRKNPFVDVTPDIHNGAHPITLINNPLMPSDRRVIHDEELSRFQRKRKKEEARMQRELEAQERKIRKEVEKQDILRQKREEQIKREMDRCERERQKEKERLLRERQREEERCQRKQRREMERREKLLQKESIRAEKLRQKEELRRQKEEARIKAANERATARRIVKEPMELIEDERLELMELAASKKGLSSILALDYETIQNLEIYRDKLTSFPPKSVQLKRIFSIQPWSDSDENVGNLLMVWRFLITFADVLGIWPFTLDELVQAFHDHDPRLLGEIHIALLRSIIKDIEDVARTPSIGLVAIQNCVANSGGHPRVVEGARVWGFDIRNWQRHLNPLTWPEILRQFALSAGFGPQLKKRKVKLVHPCNNNEGNDGRDIISNLRSGVAVENAVAIMQEKSSRRSRHCLTPGTIKFAAFHVLSLEGSRGLNIMEVAEKIQKSGLRDLTTSKTPEASISAALSRDTKLFERTAPSTYCVRPAYRKDPADSEAVYSAARERIRIFTSGFVGAEEADDGERGEYSDGDDVAEDPENDDLVTASNTKKGSSNDEEFNAISAMRYRIDNSEILQINDASHEKVGDNSASLVAEHFNEHKDMSTSSQIAICSNDVVNPDVKVIVDVDESILGEPWVQGLTEGEYSDLSVEERLHALVDLIGVATEGNSIRIVLEERLEASNALKKQMWAEARRTKEDYPVKNHSLVFPSGERKQSPMLTVDHKNDEALLTSSHDQHEQGDALLENQNHLQCSSLEGNMHPPVEKSKSNLKLYICHLAEQIYMYRSLPLGLDRRHNRYWQFVTSAKNDPGCGRIFVEMNNGRWKMIDSEEGFDALLASLDVRGIRESLLHMMLQKIEMSFKESVRRNVHNVNKRVQIGDAVMRLKTEVVEMASVPDCSANIPCPTSVCIDNLDVLETSTSFVVQLGGNEADNRDAFIRNWDFEKWMRKECLNSSVLSAMKFGKKRCRQLVSKCDVCHHVYFSGGTPCPSCHRTFSACNNDFSSSEHIHSKGKVKIGTDCSHVSTSLPCRMRLLKIFLSIVEVTLPQETLLPLWTDNYRKSWSTKLDTSLTTEDLLQILTSLEYAIKRKYLASKYETTSELLSSFSSPGCPTSDSVDGERIPVLPWVPSTTAAIALRLLELDACIFYISQQKLQSEKDKKIGIVMKLPLKHASAKTSYKTRAIETAHRAEHTVKKWVDHGISLTSYRRGQRTQQDRGHSRNGRSSKGRVVSSGSDSGNRMTTSSSKKMGKLLGWKGRPCGQGGSVRGPRSTRSRQKPPAKVDFITFERDSLKDIMEEAPGILVREEIKKGEAEAARSAYEDDVYKAIGGDDDYLMDNNDEFHGGFNGKFDNLTEGHNNVDAEDGVNDNDDENENGQMDLDVADYVIGDDSDTEENREENTEQNMDQDGASPTPSDYSD